MSCKALILYWSRTGNTLRVAETIHSTVEGYGIPSEMMGVSADLNVDVFSYELVFLGSPVHLNLGPPAIMRFVQGLRRLAANLPSAPERPGRYAVVFCTYGGSHTGIGEALPLLKYMRQGLEHEGVRVVEEWPVVGEFPGTDDPYYNTGGRWGDITGRPNANDLRGIEWQVSGLLRRLQHKLGIQELVRAHHGH